MVRQDHGDHTHEWDEELTEDGTPATLSEMRGKDFAHLLEDIDGYLCELTGAQIRSGLHTLGQLPGGEQLTDLLFSLCRLPNLGTPSLREAVANACGLALVSLLMFGVVSPLKNSSNLQCSICSMRMKATG